MAEDSLRSAIDAIRSRLHEELETQLAHLTARHADEVESARRAAEADAEQRWSAKVEEVRNEWTARLESEIANVRGDAERRMVAESTRLRVEAEQAAAERAAAAREELERAVADERSRVEQQLAEERARAEQQLAGERSRLEEQFAAERSKAEEQLAAERMQSEELRARLQEHTTERTRLEEEGAAQRARFEAHALERARIEEQLAEERSRAEEHASAIERHALDLQTERSRAEDLESQRRQAEENASQHRDRLSAERDELVRTLDAARHELAGLQGELDRVKQTLESATEERDGAIRDHEAATQHAIRLTSELSTEREKWGDDARKREERDTALADARLAERQSQLAVVERVLSAVRAMDRAKSLSDVLASLTSSAAAEAPRVALFVINGTDLRGWKSAGFTGEASALHASAKDTGLLGEALRKRETVVTGDSDGPAAPGFAHLPEGRAGIAVPLLVGNQPVAVLYADDAADGTPAAPASWPEAIQILGRHASVTLAHLTAARAAEAMRRSLGAGPAPAASAAGKTGEDGNSARRYARLLVSEIKLYNEAAVQIGRQKRDLLARLKPEIDRARKLYAQRISPAIDSRGTLFQQELVQTLADGDPSLLGNPA